MADSHQAPLQKLRAYLHTTQLLGSIHSALYYDQNTAMPAAGARRQHASSIDHGHDGRGTPPAAEGPLRLSGFFITASDIGKQFQDTGLIVEF